MADKLDECLLTDEEKQEIWVCGEGTLTAICKAQLTKAIPIIRKAVEEELKNARAHILSQCAFDHQGVCREGKVEEERLRSIEPREIIGIFTRNVIYTERQRKDGLLTSIEWSSQIFEHEAWLEAQILALIPTEEENNVG